MALLSQRAILVVDDSYEDHELMRRAFRKAGVTNAVEYCTTGEAALRFLRREGVYADRPLEMHPSLILLDLNLPGSDGLEILREIKTDARLRSIPVVVLTTSLNARDIRSCYDAGTNSYIQKPLKIDDLIDMARRLKEYWLEMVVLPSGSRE